MSLAAWLVLTAQHKKNHVLVMVTPRLIVNVEETAPVVPAKASAVVDASRSTVPPAAVKPAAYTAKPEAAKPEAAKPQAPAQLPALAADTRAQILPPIPAGEKPACVPPDRAEVLRALPRPPLGIDNVLEVFRDDIEIVLEKLIDQMDPPRFYPLIGPAQLHRCHWKCTVHFTETVLGEYPFPFRVKRRCVEVIYLDNDNLHICDLSPCVHHDAAEAVAGSERHRTAIARGLR